MCYWQVIVEETVEETVVLSTDDYSAQHTLPHAQDDVIIVGETRLPRASSPLSDISDGSFESDGGSSPKHGRHSPPALNRYDVGMVTVSMSYIIMA